MSKYGVFSGPYFPAFGLNTERYEVSLRIQSACGKIRTRKTPYLDTFHTVSGLKCVHVRLLLPEAAPRGVLLKNSYEKFRIIHRKTYVLESLFNKVAGLQAWNFIIKKHQHRFFLVNIVKFIRAPILKNICEQLLLYFTCPSGLCILLPCFTQL